MKKYQATEGKVIVEILEEDGITSSGLHVVRSSKKRPLKGRVLSVGRDRRGYKRIFKSPCEVGDIVHYKKGATFRINSRFEGSAQAAVYFGDIVGVVGRSGLKATYDNLVVKVFYKDTSDVIYIPDTAKKEVSAFVGVVLSIGPEYPATALNIKVGDFVLFPRNEGFQIIIDDEVFHSLYPKHVRAKVDCPKEQLHEMIN